MICDLKAENDIAVVIITVFEGLDITTYVIAPCGFGVKVKEFNN